MGVGKGFLILRSLVYIVLLSVVLAFIPVAYGDMRTALIVGAGTFLGSLLITSVLVWLLKGGR